MLSGSLLAAQPDSTGSQEEIKAKIFAADPSIRLRCAGTPAEFAANQRGALETEANALLNGTLSEERKRHVIQRYSRISDDIRRGLEWEEPVCQVTIPYLRRPPAIDGMISPGEWNGSLLFEGEYLLNQREKADKRPSKWQIGWNKDTLYLAVEFKDSTPMIFRYIGFEKENNPIYLGDTFEFFLRPSLEKRVYYEYLVNPAGDLWVLQHMNDPFGHWLRLEEHFATQAYCKSRITSSGYQIELAIPLDDFRKTTRRNLFKSNQRFSFMLVHTDRSHEQYLRGTPVPLLYDGHNIFGYLNACFQLPEAP